MAQSLRFEQIGFAPSQLLLRLLAGIDVRQQVVPADDPTLDVAKWETARLEPPVLTIRPTDAVLEFVGQTGLNGVLPRRLHARQVGRVNGITRAPLLQVFKRAAEILEHLTVDVLDPAFGCHDRDQTGKRFDDQPKAFFAGPTGECLTIALGWIG